MGFIVERFFHQSKIILLYAFVMLCISQPTRADLPQLGDPSLQDFSSQQEKKLGEAFYQTLRANLTFVEDVQLNHYISALGQKLVAHANATTTDFKFFIIESDTVNAFAGPDAHIGFNSGLILRAENESQLASVMAHEIAHVTQRHLARMISESDTSAALTFGAVLAAILIGSQSPDAAQAILATGIASSYQDSINFTRQNEYEADRIGIGILADAGIDPNGMVGFFEILLEQSQGLELEYLRTHPLNVNRVSEAKHRAANFNSPLRSNSDDYRFAKARLQVLTTQHPNDLIVKTDKLITAIDYYRQALVYIRLHKTGTAIKLLQHSSKLSKHPWAKLALASALQQSGRMLEASKILDTLIKLYPGYLPVTLAHAELMLANNERLQQTITQLKHQLQTDNKAIVHKTLARAYYQNGQTTAALEATGNQYLLQGYKELALQQYENALSQSPISTTTKARLRTKISKLKPKN